MNEPKIKCLIVDDEPVAREIVEGFVAQTTSLELVASCEDAFEALEILQHQTIDLLFSDIQMPKVNGLELVKALPYPPTIIFITAHENFAVQSYELNIADYLLKPVSYDRFLKAVHKATLHINTLKKGIATTNDTLSVSYFFIKANNKLTKVLLADVLYIESIKDYIKIHTPQNTLVAYSSLKAMEEKLPTNKFFRIHQSYIVSLEQIKSLMGNMVELANGVSLPVSKSHKTQLHQILNIGEGL